MTDPTITINLLLDNTKVHIPYTPTTTAEDVCINLCKQLSIGTIARHLFALRIFNKQQFLMPSAKFSEKYRNFDLRIRFKVANLAHLRKLDPKAYDYYFHQARMDVLESKIPDIANDNRMELLGLGITDMYRVMLEKGIAKECVENEYKKYVPKTVMKKHSFFVKKPIQVALGKLQKSGFDVGYVKFEYLRQLDIIAPQYLSESYKAVTDQDGSICNILMKVFSHAEGPSLKYCLESEKDHWQQICTIEELGFVSIRNDGTVEISRKNGIPFYSKFDSVTTMLSFISFLDGYYRLTCKWTFNICKDVITPSLQKLHTMKCHGPVGGEFSYAKLEEKRANRVGCFIIRESETKYNSYFIDVCTNDSSKPKTLKLELIGGTEFIFNDDLTRYKSIKQLMAAYSDPNGTIFLHECLPPSECDNSPLLLCQPDGLKGESLTDSSALNTVISSKPLCISCKDLQLYKENNSLDECKLSHLGMEYQGTKNTSDSYAVCQSWSVNYPFEIPKSIKDSWFPDGSRQKAKNYCRNPTGESTGPYCYTINPHLRYDSCGLSLCRFSECRITGPGIEYGGRYDKSVSGRKCLSWNKKRKKVKEGNIHRFYKKFHDSTFSDGSTKKARKFCRNPNGDNGGPWCFIRNIDTDDIEKEYCDIPFCDEPDYYVFTKNTPIYSHYTDFDGNVGEFKFGIKLWNSDAILNATAKLVLSLLPLPLTPKEIDEKNLGFEITISNRGSSLSFGSLDTPEVEESVGVLKGSQYTWFVVTWLAPFVSLTLDGQKMPLFLAEYKAHGDIFAYSKSQFRYYAIRGDNVFFAFENCISHCKMHTTTSDVFQQFWELKESNTGYELNFHLRSWHSAQILLVPTPTLTYPRLTLVLQGTDNFTRIILETIENGSKTVIKEIKLIGILNYWKYSDFSLNLFGSNLQFNWKKPTGIHQLFEVKHEKIANFAWFSIASDDTVAHWLLYCQEMPPNALPPEPYDPECALNANEADYSGHQAVTSKGSLCLPWISFAAKSYQDKSRALDAWNYCRDPQNDQHGTFCYVLKLKPERKVIKEYCQLRLCKSLECKTAGTGNDYIGKIFLTRSNRTCLMWDQSRGYTKDQFPDRAVQDAKNFCRNPTRDTAGMWCYTNDPNVIQDLCHVYDCDRTESAIIVVTERELRWVYILPSWKDVGLHFGLKQWNPDLLDGISFEFRPRYGSDSLTLVIGANLNERLLLYRGSELIRQKTMPHLISSGRWSDFWLKIGSGGVALGYNSIPQPFFEWHPNVEDAYFEPMFVNFFAATGKNPIAIFFPNRECHTENVTSDSFYKIFPINLWDDSEYNRVNNNFTLVLRGTIDCRVALIRLHTDSDHWVLKIGLKEISLNYGNNMAASIPQATPPFTSGSWHTFFVHFTENHLNLSIKNRTIFTYESLVDPLVFYYFSIAANKSGWIVWAVNCPALDIDGAPRDGGWSTWSPWQCTVNCGGGQGVRIRTCTNPAPNIYGKNCVGNSVSTGSCNDYECGDLSPEILDLMIDELRQHSNNLEVEEGGSVLIQNNDILIRRIHVESPDAYVEWTLNGVFIKPQDNRVTFNKHRGSISLAKLQFSDAGIYVCIVYRINGKRAILSVTSLVVLPSDYTKMMRATQNLIFSCNSVVLAYIYTGLSLKIVLNDEVYIDYGHAVLAAVNTQEYTGINRTHEGKWKCVVEQKELGLIWITNYLKIIVLKPPNLYTHLMEDELTAPLFSWMKTENNVLIALILITLCLIVLVILFVFIYLNFCTLKRRKYRRMR